MPKYILIDAGLIDASLQISFLLASRPIKENALPVIVIDRDDAHNGIDGLLELLNEEQDNMNTEFILHAVESYNLDCVLQDISCRPEIAIKRRGSEYPNAHKASSIRKPCPQAIQKRKFNPRNFGIR